MSLLFVSEVVLEKSDGTVDTQALWMNPLQIQSIAPSIITVSGGEPTALITMASGATHHVVVSAAHLAKDCAELARWLNGAND